MRVLVLLDVHIRYFHMILTTISDKAAHLCMKCLQEFPNKPQLKSHSRTCEGIQTNENSQTLDETQHSQIKDDERMETTENEKESG